MVSHRWRQCTAFLGTEPQPAFGPRSCALRGGELIAGRLTDCGMQHSWATYPALFDRFIRKKKMNKTDRRGQQLLFTQFSPKGEKNGNDMMMTRSKKDICGIASYLHTPFCAFIRAGNLSWMNLSGLLRGSHRYKFHRALPSLSWLHSFSSGS